MPDGFLDLLSRTVRPGACLRDEGQLLSYECDALTHFRRLPRAVVLPESTEEVCAIVKLCRAHSVPYTGRGAGTGLSGHPHRIQSDEAHP